MSQHRSSCIKTFARSIFHVFALCVLFQTTSNSQLLEPRALTNVPVGLNFVLFGYGYAAGNILIDPSVPIEDLQSELHTFAGAYVRSINFFGKSAKVDAIVPSAIGHWEGRLNGIDSARNTSGLGDIRIRLSVNLTGAPALKPAEYAAYEQNIIFGASLQIFLPTGKYESDRLINLGSNRFVFRPQLGMSKKFDNWILETYLSLWIFTTNNNFLNGGELKQRPLLGYKLHVIRTLPHRMWIAFDAGYGMGSRSIVNGVEKDTRISTLLFALGLAAPIGKQHTLRIVGSSGVRLEQGSDFDRIALFYQYRWIGKK